MEHNKSNTPVHISLLLVLLAFSFTMHAQETDINWPSVNAQVETGNTAEQPDTTVTPVQTAPQDSTAFPSYAQDSLSRDINAPSSLNLDSIAQREQFIKDSIAQREAFIRDSLIERQRVLDSLNLFKDQFQKLLEASYKTESEDIITHFEPIEIVGDSTLSDLTYNKLIFNLSHAYTPWKKTLNLSTRPVKFGLEKDQEQISYIKTDRFTHKYVPRPKANMLIIHSSPRVFSKRYGKLYSEPVDSVFYNAQGRIVKIKRYNKFYQVSASYKKGAYLYTHATEVKQFDYTTTQVPSKIEIVKFCDRWRKADPEKVCGITTYTLTPNGNNFTLTRQNSPANNFADGTFNFEYDPSGNLKTVAFQNKKKNENWKTVVELNDEGNVSRYVYINNDKVNRTLLVEYHNEPGAKHKVETISCYFEDDRISYRQVNNTTGKVRVRDRLTLEWSPWE